MNKTLISIEELKQIALRKSAPGCEDVSAVGIYPVTDEAESNRSLQVKRAAEQLAEMVQGAGDFAENLREFGKNFTAEEMRILREHESIPQELFDKFLDIIFEMAARVFELGGLKPPPAKELPHTFVFHFTVCAFAHALQWNAMGGAEKPEKLVNDLVDVNIAAFATFFDGFMSTDARASATYKNASFLLKLLADHAPKH